MINGSILRHFNRLTLSTADEKHYTLENNFLSRIALGLIGVPHLGFRMRARIILSEAYKTDHSMKFLDAGCGYGMYSMLLREKGYDIDSIDIDHNRIKALHEMITEYPPLEGIKLFDGSLTDLPFTDNLYDRVICSEVIEHIKDDHKAVSELARVLSPKGILILSVPYNSKNNQKIFKMFGHERPGYSREGLESMLLNNGLELIKDFYYERPFGSMLFKVFNRIKSKALMGVLFYPFFLLYLIDYYLGIGEPNQIVITARKI